MFYLGASYWQRRVCYIRQGQPLEYITKYVKRDDFAPGFMVWAGVSARGKTSLVFIDRKVKVNSDTYIQKVLKPFVRNDLPRLFPGELRESMVFHQDSASSHTSKRTLQYLDDAGINYITPEEWMPKSPDAAPMDYSIWGILKRNLQRKSIRTLAGLKRALKKAWNDLSQDVIDRALRSWPKRCRLIYYGHGSHIEHLLK